MCKQFFPCWLLVFGRTVQGSGAPVLSLASALLLEYNLPFRTLFIESRHTNTIQLKSVLRVSEFCARNSRVNSKSSIMRTLGSALWRVGVRWLLPGAGLLSLECRETASGVACMTSCVCGPQHGGLVCFFRLGCLSCGCVKFSLFLFFLLV